MLEIGQTEYSSNSSSRHKNHKWSADTESGIFLKVEENANLCREKEVSLFITFKISLNGPTDLT